MVIWIELSFITNCSSELILMCACYQSGMVNTEAEAPYKTCTRGWEVHYLQTSCVEEFLDSSNSWGVSLCPGEWKSTWPIHSGSKEGKFGSRTHARLLLAVLQAGTITATIRDSHQYFSNSLQGGLEVPCVLRFYGEVKNIDKIRTSK